MKLDEILPYFSEKDCVLPIGMDKILAKFGFPGTIQITEENLDEYSETTIQLLKNELKRNELSKRAKLSGQEYSYIETGKKLETAYHDLLKEKMYVN